MNDRIHGLPSQMPGATNAPSANTASSAEFIGTATGGVVHDPGNLIQIARSAVNIISGDPTVRAAGDPGPAIAHAHASLEGAGALIREAVGAAHRPTIVEELEAESPALDAIADGPGKKPFMLRERAENVRNRDEGVLNLDDANALKVTPFKGTGSVVQLINAFGGKDGFRKVVRELQDALYEGAV